MPNSLQNMNTTRTVVLNYRESGNYRNDLKTIADFHRSYDPLQYPLIFPQGTDGWHFKLRSRTREHKKTVTLVEYARFHIMKRSEKYNILHLASKLFQQWIVE